MPRYLAALLGLLAMAVALAVPDGGGAAVCASHGADAGMLAAARSAVASTCDCRTSGDRRSWYACVRDVLNGLRAADRLSRSCMGQALRFEMDSVCGRPGKIVCCPAGWGAPYPRTSAVLSPERCDGFVSRLAHRAEACFASPPDRLADPEACGNGRLDAGEDCDPPDGRTCSEWCQACAAASGATVLACSDEDTLVTAAAVPGTFLATFSVATRRGPRAVASRLDTTGAVREDAVALDPAARQPTTADSATSDGSGFYAVWEGSAGKLGRRVAAAGALAGAIDVILGPYDGSGEVGTCRSARPGPLELAPTLDGTGVHFTQRYNQAPACGFPDSLGGVPFVFDPPPLPVVASSGPGRLARGASDVAAAWWTYTIETDEDFANPPITLWAGWVEPLPGAFPLVAPESIEGTPGLAAVGDVFLAAYATGSGGEVRAQRFSRSAGVLDAPPGRLVATSLDGAGDVIVTSDGERFVVSWREWRPARGRADVRLVRVASDGDVIDSQPIDVVALDPSSGFAVAADPAAILVAYTQPEDSDAWSVRAVLVPDEVAAGDAIVKRRAAPDPPARR